MKWFLKLIACWLLVPTLAAAQNNKASYDSLTARVLTKQQMQEDLQYLRKVMEEVHPGLYRYTPKPDMDRRLDSFYQQVTGPLPYYSFFNQVSSLVAGVRCAHTHALPGPDWEAHFMANAKLIPFSTHIIDDHLYVSVNLTTDTTIKPGYEIETINGERLPQIFRTIYDRTWSDGYNKTSKTQRFNTGHFSLLYYMLVARPDSFTVQARDRAGRAVTVTYPAMTPAEGRKYFRQNPVNKEIVRLYVDRKREDLKLDIRKDLNAGILTIRSFGGSAAKKLGNFLPKAMKEITQKKIGHLVIDLRYNGGGWDSAGVLLFTWLIHEPSKYYLRQHTVSDSSSYYKLSDLSPEDLANAKNELVREPDGTFSIKAQYAAGLPLQYPVKQPYAGKLYFLMNGGSASTTAEFLSAARAHQLGTFIGEEAGGNYEGGNGGSFIPLYLPNSKIKVTIPIVYYDNYTKPPVVKGHGVLPDHAVPDDLDNIFRGVDTQLEYVLQLIREGK